MSGEMTFEEAKELTVLKWQFIVDNDCKTDDIADLLWQYDIPEKLEEYKLNSEKGDNCAMCEKYRDFELRCQGKECIKCPLSIGFDGIACHRQGHPYLNWFENPSLETAQAVLDLVKNCKPINDETD